MAPVHPREVFCQAVKKSAAAVIFVHNHPSGDCTPSRNDIAVTDRLIEGSGIIHSDALNLFGLCYAKRQLCYRLKLYSFYLPYPGNTKKLLIGHLIEIEQIAMPAGKYVLRNINHSLVSCAGLYNVLLESELIFSSSQIFYQYLQ